MSIAFAVTPCGEDPTVCSVLEMQLGKLHLVFHWPTGIRGDYENLIDSVDNNLLAECAAANVQDAIQKASELDLIGDYLTLTPKALRKADHAKIYGAIIRDYFEATSPEPILCYAPWDWSMVSIQSDFHLPGWDWAARLVDIKAWGYPDHLESLESLATKYGITYNSSGRCADECAVILEIAKRRDK